MTDGMDDNPKTIIVTGIWKTNVILSILVGVSALASVWLVIPYRVTAIEERLDRIERRSNERMELLIRIDERVSWMTSELERVRDGEGSEQ